MADTPEATWSGDQWVVWLGAGFGWLAEQGWFPLLEGVNGAGPEEEARPWAGECRAGFLKVLGVDEAELDTDPLFDVLRKFLLYVDDDLGDDLARWDFLREPGVRNAKILEYWEPWSVAITLAWVTPEQRERLGTLGDDWPGWLPARLTSWWPEWPGADPDELATFLDGYLFTLVELSDDDDPQAPAATGAGGQLESLTWLTDAQQATLNSWTAIRGEEWHTWLPQQLSDWWPEWTRSTPGRLTPWLDECLLSMIIDLEWVRPDQAAELGGDWAGRLRTTLDQMWPTWTTQTDPQMHQQWLTDWLPTLAGQPMTVGSPEGAAADAPEQPVSAPAAEALAATGDDASSPSAAEVTATVIEQIGLAGLRQLAEQVPAVTQLSPPELEQLEQLFSRFLAEQLAVAGRR